MKMRKILALLLFALLTIQFICPEQSRGAEFDEGIYNKLLRKYVSKGQVDYINWKKNDFDKFEEYINFLEKVSLSGMNKNEQKAFWINAYNALTIYAVLKRISTIPFFAKLFSVRVVPGFFDKIKYNVAGESLALNDIENKKLKEQFGDPRIHFAIVCASRSCPRIQSAPFTGMGLDGRLNDATRKFIRSRTGTRLDRKNNIFYISEIFKWYEEDFVKSSGTVMDFIRKYLGADVKKYLSEHKTWTKYNYYDWMVNLK